MTLAILSIALIIGLQSPDYCAVVPLGKPSLPAKLMEGMGKVDFPITTASKEAQAFFNQGVAQLYAFWFIEAERSFMQAAALDPNAGMAYWGIAMSSTGDFRPTYQNLIIPGRSIPLIPAPGSGEARAREAIMKAQELKPKLTGRERLYVDAVAAHHNPRSRDADADYVRAMRKLVAAVPDDLEAKAILALVLESGFDSVSRAPRAGSMESLALLKEVLAKNPDHVGAHHFLIHGYEDSREAREAWKSCERYPELVSNIPHALHMPGHIYSQTARYEEAVQAFETAADNEKRYMDSDALYPRDHYLHNQQFLIYVLGVMGKYRQAVEESRKLMAVPENPRERSAIEGSSAYRSGWFGLMRTLVRFEKWDEILDGSTLLTYDKPRELAWYHWARGVAQATKGSRAAAGEEFREMQNAIDRLKRVIDPIPRQLYVARAELEALIEGDLELLQKAATMQAEMLYTEPPVYPRPVLEQFGKVALHAENFRAAEDAYRKLLDPEPGGGRALWGLAQALSGQGKKAEADSVLAEFKKAWASADPELLLPRR